MQTAPAREHEPQQLCLAGKFSTAADAIHESAVRIATDLDEAARRRELFALYDRIRDIYDRDVPSLRLTPEQLGQTIGAVAATVSEVAQGIASQAVAIKDQGEQYAWVVMRNWSFAKNLPYWGSGGAMAGFALAAISLPAVAPSLPVLAAIHAIELAAFQLSGGAALGGLMGATTPLVLRYAWSKLTGKIAAGNSSNESDDETSTANSLLGLDDFVRSSVVFALVLELQGSPYDEIAERIQQAVGDLANEPLTSLAEIDSLLRDINDRLCSWSVRSSC